MSASGLLSVEILGFVFLQVWGSGGFRVFGLGFEFRVFVDESVRLQGVQVSAARFWLVEVCGFRVVQFWVQGF